MSTIDKIDTSIVYGEIETGIIDHSLGILSKIISRYNDPAMLQGLSIDKMDSVLRVVDTSMSTVNKLAATKLKIASIKSESDDRTRMMNILTNVNLRREINASRSAENFTELRDVDIIPTEVVRGELSTGVDQLSIELLELENEIEEN